MTFEWIHSCSAINGKTLALKFNYHRVITDGAAMQIEVDSLAN